MTYGNWGAKYKTQSFAVKHTKSRSKNSATTTRGRKSRCRKENKNKIQRNKESLINFYFYFVYTETRGSAKLDAQSRINKTNVFILITAESNILQCLYNTLIRVSHLFREQLNFNSFQTTGTPRICYIRELCTLVSQKEQLARDKSLQCAMLRVVSLAYIT